MEHLTQAEREFIERLKTQFGNLSDRAMKDIKNAAARELTKRHPSLPMSRYEEKLQAQKRELIARQKSGRWLK